MKSVYERTKLSIIEFGKADAIHTLIASVVVTPDPQTSTKREFENSYGSFGYFKDYQKGPGSWF